MAHETKQRELSPVTLPELIAIPAGSASVVCECGARFWWVNDAGARVPVSCPSSIRTKAHGVIALPTQAPMKGSGGIGIRHHIDCTKREKFRKSAPARADGQDVAALVALAEAIAERHGVRCTGAPELRETCGGFAVVVMLVGDKLFATPCSAHADAVQLAVRRAGRRTDAKPLDVYLVDAAPELARAFVEKAGRIRTRNAELGFFVPANGPLRV